jgi:hypothetical protein
MTAIEDNMLGEPVRRAVTSALKWTGDLPHHYRHDPYPQEALANLSGRRLVELRNSTE